MNNPNNPTAEVERLGIHFRVQHIILFTTFLTLSFTGWGLKYAHVEDSHWLMSLFGGAENAGIIHKIAGIAMVAGFLYHLVYIACLFAKGRVKITKVNTIIPLPGDIVDVVHNFMYFMGISKTRPQFGRFSYAQKFDYWAVFWGMAIIGLSGLALAFPVTASYFFPAFTTGWIWQLIAVLHSDEALLAIVFIFFWHFYNEHLKPEIFPMSWVWLTGKISLDEMKHNHPLEYEAMRKEKNE